MAILNIKKLNIKTQILPECREEIIKCFKVAFLQLDKELKNNDLSLIKPINISNDTLKIFIKNTDKIISLLPTESCNIYTMVCDLFVKHTMLLRKAIQDEKTTTTFIIKGLTYIDMCSLALEEMFKISSIRNDKIKSSATISKILSLLERYEYNNISFNYHDPLLKSRDIDIAMTISIINKNNQKTTEEIIVALLSFPEISKYIFKKHNLTKKEILKDINDNITEELFIEEKIEKNTDVKNLIVNDIENSIEKIYPIKKSTNSIIKQLEALLETYGDIKVYYGDCKSSWYDNSDALLLDCIYPIDENNIELIEDKKSILLQNIY